MQKHNQIKALFFLGIFSMLLLHQVAPHLHHQHEVEHKHKAVAHSDAHGHQHDVPEKESPNKGLFDLFLEMHVHSLVSNEILLTNERSTKHHDVKKEISTPVPVNHHRIIIILDDAIKKTVYQPPNNYFNSYLSSLDSRGPPSLG